MKKHPTINYSWPALLFDLKADPSNGNYSRGKLGVFYKGETADHRYFSDAFCEKLIKTLPYAPVVSHYDEEKDDFVGHATEQNIYGIVDPCVEPTFQVMEDNNTWAICDVVLYTDRPDKVGEIAKKIIGHSQSLELNPDTVDYKINYDEKKHFKNIEFTAGDIIGVSVLGSDQKPAFTGSTFFEYDEQFANKMKLLKEYCEKQHDQNTSGGKIVNLQEFMKLSWGDISQKVMEAICHEYENDAFVMLVDMFNDSAIVRFYYYIEGNQKLMRIKYSTNENGEVTLGDINEVHIAYEDVFEEEVGVNNNAEVTETVTNDEINNNAGTDISTASELSTTNENIETASETLNSDITTVNTDEVASAAENSSAAQLENAQVTDTEKKVSDGNEQNSTTQEEGTSSASFTDSERAQFETLKREKKVNVLNSYKDKISEEDYDNLLNAIDTFAEEKDLELEILKAYQRNLEENAVPTRGVFSLNSIIKTNEKKDDLATYIRQQLNR